MSEDNQYAERDLMALDEAGNHYIRHVDHMTREKLHSKSDIAAELGWRDMQIAELKAQRDALAAENAALKQVFATKEFSTEVTDAFSDTAVLRIDGDEHHSWQWVDNDSAVIRAVLEVMKPETPATDAYLNSVRAEGVEILTGKLQQLIDEGVFDAKEIGVAAGAVHEGAQIAAQLRAGEPE